MTVLKEHDPAVLATDVPTEGLVAGDVGTVIRACRAGQGYEVEYFYVRG